MKEGNLEGIIVPLITPIHDDETPNYSELEILTDSVINGGVNAIFANSTTGEFARFHCSEQVEILKTVVRVSAGRVPVLAGVSSCGTKLTIEKAQMAVSSGADYIVTTFPYYFPTTSHYEQVSFLRDLITAVDLPVILYNIPAVVGYSVSADVLDAIVDMPGFYGIKDTSGDRKIVDMELNQFHDRIKVFIGDERMTLCGLMRGCDGVVPSMANCFPKIWKKIWEASKKKDWDECRSQCEIVDKMNQMNKFSDSWMSPNIWRKEALKQMKIIGSAFTKPSNKMTKEDREIISDFVNFYMEKY